MSKKALITGSAGLIGSEATHFLFNKGYEIVGVDNDMRKYFFGSIASTKKNNEFIKSKLGEHYTHYNIDIRDKNSIESVFKKYNFDIIIHTAAQPSHDWAVKEPLTDFEINALGTHILLENYRKFCPNATFIFTSTNKVYGDSPNNLPLKELDDRFEIDENHPYYKNGIPESMSIDQSKHSIFGASKVAADIMVQEYGRYFDLKTGVFRGGCLTGPQHNGAELHGFLAYLVHCIKNNKKYNIFGYKGKQVRDNIHSFDLVNMFWHFHQNPRSGEVYNAGGGRHSNVSVLEAIKKIETLTGKKALYEYKDENRIGDHIWYISDVSKFKEHYPDWDFTYNIDEILRQMCDTI